jgi:hypothetical protein
MERIVASGFTVEEKRRVKVACAAKDLTVSEVIRRILMNWVEQVEWEQAAPGWRDRQEERKAGEGG